jgi:hypothetical protein
MIDGAVLPNAYANGFNHEFQGVVVNNTFIGLGGDALFGGGGNDGFTSVTRDIFDDVIGDDGNDAIHCLLGAIIFDMDN